MGPRGSSKVAFGGNIKSMRPTRTGNRMSTALVVSRGGRPLPQVQLGVSRHNAVARYRAEAVDLPHGSRLKWLVSTLFAAVVGLTAIGFVVFSSLENDGNSGLVAALERAGRAALEPLHLKNFKTTGSSIPKSDRLKSTTSALSTAFIIHDSVKQVRDQREFITIKPYARVVTNLAAATVADDQAIPAFNPYALYAVKPAAGAVADELSDGKVAVKLLELVGGILPEEDEQELDGREVSSLVQLARSEIADTDGALTGATVRKAVAETVETVDAAPTAISASAPTEGAVVEPLVNTAIIEKNVFEEDTDRSIEDEEVRMIRIGDAETLTGVLLKAGAEDWQAREINEVALPIIKVGTLVSGQELRLVMAPSPTGDQRMEPIVVTLFSEGQRHLVSVVRNDSGEYIASEKPVPSALQVTDKAIGKPARPSVYTALYASAIAEGLPTDMIEMILRMHAYDVDFKRRVSPTDGLEVFYDLTEDTKSTDAKPGELLFSSLTIGGETRRFYRYRTPDSVVEFYDETGSNARRFLVKKPVRGGDEVRFTSGFGMRMHPLFHQQRMHTGIDWAAPMGTPILASGTGFIEQIGRKGGNGNYIRIRHANGYQTAYSHMSRFAQGLHVGSKVTQGQIIGYIGSTGWSSGPHLHFEVLVNNSYVNPMTIQVPRERQLQGKQLLDFQRERARIEDLMRRSPVSTKVSQAIASNG